MSLQTRPFAGVVTPTALTTLDRVRFTTALTQIANLIPNPSADPGVATAYAPDFDEISPNTAGAIRYEINSVIATFNSTNVQTATTNV